MITYIDRNSKHTATSMKKKEIQLISTKMVCIERAKQKCRLDRLPRLFFEHRTLTIVFVCLVMVVYAGASRSTLSA